MGSKEPVARPMPLLDNRDTFTVLVTLCVCSTRLSLSKVSPAAKRFVMRALLRESKRSLAKLDSATAVSSALTWTQHHHSEVSGVVAAASGQLLLCVSDCILLFAPRGDRWLVAVHSDDRDAVAIGWKQPAAECSQRPIQDPITEKPVVELLHFWEVDAGSDVFTMAISGDAIAVGSMDCMLLLNAHTGAVATDALKGRQITFLDEDIIVGVNYEIVGKYVLYEFTANTLTNEVTIEAPYIAAMKASANGKRLHVTVKVDNQLLVYSTANWALIARIPLSGEPFGNCDIAANGLLAQGIKHRDGSYSIEVIETNTRCVTQTIRTKHTDEIMQVVFSPNSRRIVSVAWDKSAQLFDAITGQIIGEPRIGHFHSVYSVCFLTDDWFVTVSMDQSLVVWHCDSQPAIARIEYAHDSAITSVLRLSTDSFATGDNQGTVKKWKLECQ